MRGFGAAVDYGRQRRRNRWTIAAALIASLMVSLVDGGVARAGTAAGSVSAGPRTPNRFDVRSDAVSVTHPSAAAAVAQGRTLPPPATLAHSAALPMAPGSLDLRPDSATSFTGSDGRLQVDVPAGAVSSADVAEARGGVVRLRVGQIAPASGSSAGGSGHVSFGTYILQLVDATGAYLPHGLRRPVQLTMHYGSGARAMDLAHAVVVIGGTRGASGSPHTAAAVQDPAAGTLSATASLSTASSTVSFNTNAPVAAFGSPDPFNVDLNAGALTFDLPIDVPSGPGGLKPPLSLSYTSERVSEQHNLQAAAPWVGEGWNLSLGSISWAEHDVTSGCGGCAAEWESDWRLEDSFGTSAELIPPNINVSTYYDDTPNVYYNSSSNTYPNEPVHWHTSPESHTRIYSYVGPNVLPAVPAHPPCFRVFETNAIMEEFGCTSDSIEYYFVPSNLNSQYVAEWLPDLITDPEGNQIHVTYQVHPQTLNGVSYRGDVEPATIEWDSPACHDAQHACTGSAWAPLMRVNFVASHNIARSTSINSSSCNTGHLMRCDDPKDLSGSGGVSAPEVQSSFALNDLQVQVRSGASASWNTLRDYQFSYEVGGPGQLTDPVTGTALSYAGPFDLTQIKVVGADGSTALPARTFGYTTVTQHYEDDAFKAQPSNNCGWSWNTGCLLWNHSRDGNSRYIGSAGNGLGLSQTYTWDEARNNTHGVNSGGDVHDPLYCTDHGNSGSPCNVADDQNWSHAVLTARSSSVVRPSSSGNTTVTSTTSYRYRLSDLGAQPCSDCTVGYDWGNQNDADYLDFYNGHFMGFTSTTVTNPDGSVVWHHYKATGGWGLYDTGQVSCASSNPCHNAPWWSSATALHGREVEEDLHDTDGTTLLEQVLTQYQLTCPPAGESGTPSSSSFGNWDGNLVSMLDHNNPVAVCEVQPAQVDTYRFDGASSSAPVPHATVAYTYDSLGNPTSITRTTNDGGVAGSPTTIVLHADYVSNISVHATSSEATGTHITGLVADSYTSDAGGTVRRDCRFVGYDGQPFLTGQQSTITLGEPTTEDRYASCGTSANGFAASGQMRTTTTYDASGNVVAGNDPDASAGNSAHLGCTASGASHTTCMTYDATFGSLPAGASNALDQSVSLGYAAAAADGFGLWPTTFTDPNGQTASFAFDALGRPTSTTLPGETAGLTTTGTSYTVWCAATGAQAPCVEIDSTQRLNSGTTVTRRAFFDGWGNLVETREPAPGGRDVVRYAYYDPSGSRVFLSNRYFVSAYSGAPGPSAFSTPDSTQPGETATYVNLRQTNTTDALSFTTVSADAVVCGDIAGDAGCYERTTVVDPLGHETATYADALGREVYTRTYTGSTPTTYAPYATTTTGYDLLGQVSTIVHPDGSSRTTFTYDDAGRTTGMIDPDRGAEAYAYDQNGNTVETVDARGGAGTTFFGYDGLDRLTWRSTTNSQTGAYTTYSYDSTVNGNSGVDQLTGQTFSGGPNGTLQGSYAYVYDVRGRQVQRTLTVGGASYPLQASYNDSDQVLSETYPTGEVVAYGYTPEGWLQSVTRQQGSTTTSLLTGGVYAGPGGALGHLTSAGLAAGVYALASSYDQVGRLTDTKLTRSSDGATLFDQSRTFDGAGNVTSAATTLPGGTDHQVFCYDEQDRLTWAGSTGVAPCTGAAVTPGSLTAAQYTQTFGYDNLDRLTSGPMGAYTYGDPAHLHAATAAGSTYSASYDAAGNMTCRAGTSATGCAGGSPTGALIGYDNEGRLVAWQDAPTSPTAQASDLYDGDGQRVEHQATAGGSTTTTVYVGDVEEVSTTGSATTTSTYYYADGERIAMAVNGQLSYLASDGLGSVSLAVDGSGSPQASVLYAPYGAVRYASGTLPTTYGFTGQRADAQSGLDYYGARWYDPVAGQFTSADITMDGLNRYAYVHDDPTTLTDPSGQNAGPPEKAVRVAEWVRGVLVGMSLAATLATGGHPPAHTPQVGAAGSHVEIDIGTGKEEPDLPEEQKGGNGGESKKPGDNQPGKGGSKGGKGKKEKRKDRKNERKARKEARKRENRTTKTETGVDGKLITPKVRREPDILITPREKQRPQPEPRTPRRPDPGGILITVPDKWLTVAVYPMPQKDLGILASWQLQGWQSWGVPPYDWPTRPWPGPGRPWPGPDQPWLWPGVLPRIM